MKRKLQIMSLICFVFLFVGCGKSEAYSASSNEDYLFTYNEYDDVPTIHGGVTVAESDTISDEDYHDEISAEESTTEIFAPDITKPSQVVSILAVGDNLYHTNVWEQGWDGEFFDYTDVYEEMSAFINQYDIAVVNQETPLVNSDYSSYPTFGTPVEVIKALDTAGFDVATCATNHSNDKRTAGIQSTITAIETLTDMDYIGIHKHYEDYNTVKVIEKNGIKIAMLNYTYGLNGIELNSDETYLVSTLYDKDKILSDLQQAEEIADFTIVFPHWGTEYVYEETQSQIDWANFFTENGADLIIGTHPHVCEPVKWIVSENGNKALCYYSLGNYISGQTEYPRLLGGMASLNIVKDDEGVHIEDAEFLASLTYQTRGSIKPMFLSDYTNELAETAKLSVSKEDYITLWEQINESTEIAYENLQ